MKNVQPLYKLLLIATLLIFAVSEAKAVSTSLVINEIMYDPVGNEANGEWVEIYVQPSPGDLSGWTLSDTVGTTYTFPNFTPAAGDYIVIHTGDGVDDTVGPVHHLYWGRGSGVWNNSGDEALLADNSSTEIDYIAYESAGTTINGSLTWGGSNPTASEGNSIALKNNGVDTDSGDGWEEAGASVTIGPNSQGSSNNVTLCATDCYVDTSVGSDSNTGMVGSPFATIQKAIDTVDPTGAVHVAPGTYNENVTIDKQLTLEGSGNGTNPAVDTLIDPSSPGITILTGGASIASRLVVSNLTVQNASGGDNIGSGILIQEGDPTIEHITFQNITSINNSGNGIAIDHTGTVRDIIVNGCDLSNNGNAGFRIPTSITLFDGLTMSNCAIEDNAINGLTTGPGGSTGVTNIHVSNTTFARNGDALSASGSGSGDVSLFKFNGDASFTNVDITGNGAHIGMQIRGDDTIPTFEPAGTVTLDNVTFSGSYQHPATWVGSALFIAHYSDVSGISMNDVDIDIMPVSGTKPAFNLYTDSLGGDLDVGNTTFGGSANGDILHLSPAGVDATSATFTGAVDNFAVEDRVVHVIDLPGAGLVTWVPDNVFVTINSYALPTTTSPSLQRAVDAAGSGWMVNIGPGTFIEGGQININKNLTMLGQGKTSTTLNPGFDTGSSGDARGWFLVDSGIEFHLSDLTMDGTGNLVYQAIRHKGEGTIDNVQFTEIKFNESGPTYSGVGVAAFGTGPVDVTNSMFNEIGRVGVLYFGSGVTGSLFEGNMYTGKGPGDWLDYALDISAGAEVEVKDSTISGNRGVASSDGSTSAGILVTTFFGTGTSAQIHENDISDSSAGIFVGYDGSDTSSVVANYNNITGNDNGVRTTAPVVDATCNWWGAANGPSGIGLGSGDTVSNFVTFEPWLTALAPDGPCNGVPTGNLKITKVVVPVDGFLGSFLGYLDIPDWDFELDNTTPFILPGQGGMTSFDSIAAGSHAVVETPDTANFITTYSCDDAAPQAGTTATANVPGGGTSECVFTNTLKTGFLKLVKVVEGTPPAGDWEFHVSGPFGIDATGSLDKGGETVPDVSQAPFLEYIPVPLGQYTIAETLKIGYESEAFCANTLGGTVGSGTGSVSFTVAPALSITCTFTNSEIGIDLEKLVNGDDADSVPGDNIPLGDPVEFEFIVTNSGQVPLDNINLSDDKVDVSSCVIPASLAPGESFNCTVNDAAALGQHSNTATVTADTPQDQPVSDEDQGHYFGIDPMNWAFECVEHRMEVTGIGIGNPGGIINPQSLSLTDPASVNWMLAQVAGRANLPLADVPTSVEFSTDAPQTVTLNAPSSFVDSFGYTFESTLQPTNNISALINGTGSPSFQTPRALMLYANRNVDLNTWTSVGQTLNEFVWHGVGLAEKSKVINIPALPISTDVTVTAVVADNNDDDRPLVVEAGAAGISASATEVGPGPEGDLLNIVVLTLEEVPAGTDKVTITVKSPKADNGDSLAWVGLNVSYVCDDDRDDDTIPNNTEGDEDPDGDLQPNYLDTESDGDAILDSVEWNSDANGDNVIDSFDRDADQDGIPNFLDLDSDNDGKLDEEEGLMDENENGILDFIEVVPGAGSSSGPIYLPLIIKSEVPE